MRFEPDTQARVWQPDDGSRKKRPTRLAIGWWCVLAEIRAWKSHALQRIPGEIGVLIRRRWLVRHFGRCGKKPYILEGCRFVNPCRLEIGDYVRISQNVVINAGGGVKIGDYVGIGPSAKIWSINHRYDQLDTPIYAQGWTKAPVVIREDVWIAADCFIMPGVVIGRGSVISAGTVLAKSVRPYSVVAGNPGRIVGYRVDRDSYFQASIEEGPPIEDEAGKA